MSKTTLDFLIEKYGHRVDHPQPIINTDDESIQNQLDLVDKKIRQSKNFGLLSICVGVVWMLMCMYRLSTVTLDITTIFRIGLSAFFFITGVVRLNHVAELKKKKIILETILFINNAQ